MVRRFALHASARRAVPRIAIFAALVLTLAVNAGGAAAARYRLTVSPTHIKRGGLVTIYTTPRLPCSLQLTIAGRHFGHGMRYGWIQIRMPRRDAAGRVLVRVSCSKQVTRSSFTIR